MREPKYRWVYDGVNDPEIQLAEFLLEDKRRFKRTAQAVYRTVCCNRVVGFVYPVAMVHPDEPVEFKQLDDEGRLMVQAPAIQPDAEGYIYPQRPHPFGAWALTRPPEPGYMYLHSWLFSFRHIDPEFMALGDGPDDIGFAPAGSYMGLRRGEPAPEEVQAASTVDVHVVGKSNTWTVTDLHYWQHYDKNRNRLLVGSNPFGLMNCKHSEVNFTREQVLEHMETYKPARPIMVGKQRR
ncbi:TPA: hypothetical protein I8W04_000337 [Corynebacterium striatum]|uniref:hypothetical protein n=1 Tax=Corynebacterium striatum TaxID=43770 RepID=UPI001A32F2A6|nr:hypothetical protein [Corynebacterium striatum]HAT1215443.1 hypothetical protein [Corynebacterium striatum]HAT1294561.1 hypothetical protein [Corynebacterium striatum]HAT1305636.1 hypothetical protein [Corynebacterium striatum]HAT1312342.1 hypothetical protein [Corynebacterium striatum]